MRVIGITGGVASGKTTVSNILGELGAHIINADKIGHLAYEQGTSCYKNIVGHFGTTVVAENGDIDRRKLGAIVFSDSSKMAALNEIVWPEIRVLLISELDQINSESRSGGLVPIVALEAAVMIEAGWFDLVSDLWVVHVDREVAKNFLIARNSLSSEEALKRIDCQISNDERCKHASKILYNNGDLENLHSQVLRFFQEG